MAPVHVAELNDLEWKVLLALKREFAPEEIQPSPWNARAAEAGLHSEEFCRIAQALNARKIVGRFSTFLEHVKPSTTGLRVTRFNALFHWAVPPGRQLEAGGEVGRHHILTHCYWREAGPEFRNVNIMAVLLWLVAGGLVYTSGVIFFVNDHRRYCHFVWHLFVVGGTACHYFAVLSYAS
jgi:hypothetical protein